MLRQGGTKESKRGQIHTSKSSLESSCARRGALVRQVVARLNAGLPSGPCCARGGFAQKDGVVEPRYNPRLSSGQRTQKHEMQDFRRKLCFLRSDV